ncbi:hypothetical protein V8E36_000923 [Tilletia maclaganii]
MRRITSAGRDPAAQDKDNDPPPLAHPTLNFDADAAVKIIKLWHNAPFGVPDDIVKLFNAGFNIPLSLLSVAAVRDYAVNARRGTFHAKMTGKLMEEFQSWHTRDDALPFEEWAQASNTLLHLWRSIRAVPEDEPVDQDPIQLFLEHFIAVSSQVASRIRRIIWAPQGEGVGLPFHIRAIHQPTLSAAEAWISERLPVTIKSTGLATSTWNEVVTASTTDALRRARDLATATLQFYSHPVADNSERGGKRAQPNDGGSSSFRRDGDTPAGGSNPNARVPNPDSSFRLETAEALSGGTGTPRSAPNSTAATSATSRPASSATTALIVARTITQSVPSTASSTPTVRSALPAPAAAVVPRPRPGTISDALSIISTTLNANHFQLALDSLPRALQETYAYIPASIRYGISMGSFPPPSQSVFFDNHYLPEQQPIIDEWLRDSIDQGFIAGPFTLTECEAFGLIRSSPLHIVQKFDEHGNVIKNRIVYDASYPKHRPDKPPPPTPAINNYIDKEDYPCEWLTPLDMKDLIRSLPPHARVCGWD